MANSLLKSAAITGLDALIVVEPTAGEGGKGYLNEIDGFVAALTSDSTSSLYRIVRVASNVKVKSVHLDSDALSTSSAVDIALYYSDAPNDGTQVQNQGLVVLAAMFGSAVAVATAQTRLDVTNESTNYPLSKRAQPLWQAAGLAADPGGYFDIVIIPTSTITAGGNIGLTVTFVN